MGSPNYDETKPTEIRTFEPTPTFCLSDVRQEPSKTLAMIADQLSKILQEAGVEIKYINIPDASTNPDRMLGHFQAVQYR